MEPEALRLWVLTDGRPGNEAQALGLAEAIARRRPASIALRRVAPKAWTARLPAQLWHALGVHEGGWPFTAYNARVRRIKPPWPDLAIGAGRRIAPLVAALRKLHGVKTVQILDPCMPLADFDLVVAPEHDRVHGRMTGQNLIATLGYCPSSQLSKWDYSEDDDDDESNSIPAEWDDGVGPKFDSSGLYFNIGFRFLIFDSGIKTPSLSEMSRFW